MAMRRTGFYSALAILVFFAVAGIVFYYKPDAAATPARKIGSFHMFSIEEIEAVQPGFSDWLNAADPRNFVIPAHVDSCRDYHWQQMQSQRRLPLTNVRVFRPVQAQEIPCWTYSSTGKKVFFPASSWYGSASLPVISAPVTRIVWEDGIAPAQWQPDAELADAAMAAQVQMTSVLFRLDGPLPSVTVNDTAVADTQWRKKITGAMLELAKDLDPSQGSLRRAVIYWAETERSR